MTTEPEQGGLAEEEEALCPCCLQGNNPRVIFCSSCGAPIDWYAFQGPLEQVYAQGFALRRATSGPPSLMLLIGVWMVFLPMLVAYTAVLATSLKFLSFGVSVVALGHVALSWAILQQSTMNFHRKRAHFQEFGPAWTGATDFLFATVLFVLTSVALMIFWRLFVLFCQNVDSMCVHPR